MNYNCRSTIIPTEEELYGEPKNNKENEKPKETVYNKVNEELMNTLQNESDKWFDSLNQKSKKSVKNYTGSSYKFMNHLLRNLPKEIGFLDEVTYSQIDDFEKALSKYKLKDDIITYRGISQTECNEILNNSVFKDFKSTSVRKKVAQNFQADRSEHKLVMFKIPKGTNGGYVGNHSTKYTFKETKEGLEVTVIGRE